MHAKKRDWSWRSRATRGLIYQAVAVAAICAAVWFLAHNTLENMRVRGIQSGFGFFTQPAGFDIGESAFAFDSADPTGRRSWSACRTRCARRSSASC